MADYEYQVAQWLNGYELQYVAGKIYSALDTSPVEGLFDGQMTFYGNTIILHFLRELTPVEEAVVSTTMSAPDIGAFPDLTNKVVIEIPDFLHDWKALETSLGIDVAFAAVNPYNGHVFIIVNSVPNNTKKNALFQKMRELVTITKNGLSV